MGGARKPKVVLDSWSSARPRGLLPLNGLWNETQDRRTCRRGICRPEGPLGWPCAWRLVGMKLAGQGLLGLQQRGEGADAAGGTVGLKKVLRNWNVRILSWNWHGPLGFHRMDSTGGRGELLTPGGQ
ncbi:hypothetical protein HJG60_008754 [Phyllostomus discolor]|uniref:Uncharacterized protein n=1 Tax=Phyllostomus discolor TaxID=89673 RepID=A0A833YTA4_9CHIR|nr:hypothetical protein HJG60_008754 [Phyllostomus discolor]